MLRAVSDKVRLFVEKFLPSAFILALLLTFIVFIMGLVLTDEGVLDMTTHWYAGFWDFLEFTTQMILILITGYALVKAPPVEKIMIRAASKPKTQGSALLTTMLVSAAAGYISWGLGFVLGALFAIEVAKRVPAADFRLLVAGGYTAVIAILPAGLTLTAPLLVNTPGHSTEEAIGLIPLTETIFGPTMLSIAFIGLAVVIFAFLKMMPKNEDVIPFNSKENGENIEPAIKLNNTFAERMNHSKIINYAMVALGLLWITLYFVNSGFNLELNILNFIFIMLGLALHGSPERYLSAIMSGMRAAGGILIQFPFYAGIMGMMAGSGLVMIISESIVSFATDFTLPIFTYISALIVNMFVPSAGGQWQIQGPIMIEALQSFNLPPSVVVNAVSIGDMTGNLLQPFFVLPALGLARLGLKDIWGYCIVAFGLLFIVNIIIFLLTPIFL
jgi:short-chain fatty acids transporter